MNTFLQSPMTGVLRSARAEFNAHFAEMKRRHPDLDAEAFSAVLRTMVDPLASAVNAVNPDRLGATVWAAYDAALVVAAEKLAGPGGRYPAIANAWQELLPAVAPLVAESPVRVIGAVTNALTQLASTPGIREAQWTRRLLTVAPELTTVDDLLRAGQLAAWRSGLAHYRDGALAAADHLPPTLALRILDAPADAAWPEVSARLRNERWWDPAREKTAGPLRVVRSAGSFRGFGGLFIEPPTVAAIGGQIFVRSGDGHWLLTADAFGATFHRAEAAEFEAAARAKSSAPLGLPGVIRDLPALGKMTSAAETADSVAVTGTLTHAVTLLATR